MKKTKNRNKNKRAIDKIRFPLPLQRHKIRKSKKVYNRKRKHKLKE